MDRRLPYALHRPTCTVPAGCFARISREKTIFRKGVEHIGYLLAHNHRPSVGHRTRFTATNTHPTFGSYDETSEQTVEITRQQGAERSAQTQPPELHAAYKDGVRISINGRLM